MTPIRHFTIAFFVLIMLAAGVPAGAATRAPKAAAGVLDLTGGGGADCLLVCPFTQTSATNVYFSFLIEQDGFVSGNFFVFALSSNDCLRATVLGNGNYPSGAVLYRPSPTTQELQLNSRIGTGIMSSGTRNESTAEKFSYSPKTLMLLVGKVYKSSGTTSGTYD